jgi:hypothetical protein
MEQDGGFSLFKNKNSKNMTFYDYFKKAQKSEKHVIEEYKKYLKSKEKYETVFNIHLENLSLLDKQFKNFNSFKKCFLEMFDEKVDYDSLHYGKPLLLQNYDMVDKFYSKEDIVYFHLIRQILYILYVNFPPEHRLLIKNVDLNNVMLNNKNNLEEIELIIRTIDGKKTTYPLQHHEYYIDHKSLINQIEQSLSQTKEYNKIQKSNTKQKTIKKEYDILVPKDIKDKSVIHKSIKMVDKNLPIIPPLPKNKSIKTARKSISKKKEVSKKKDIKEINLPLDTPILPVFEIEMPNKKF